jgi:hypothetical protein
MKRLKLSAILILASLVASGTLAQTPVTQASFDAAYWASKPPAVAALQTQNCPARTAQALSLAAQGYTIGLIEADCYDPYQFMSIAAQFGYTWLPTVLMPPVQLAPGLTQPGVQAYDPANPPAGAITVSLVPPAPFNPPPVPKPVATPKSCVGSSLGAGFYAALSGVGCSLSDGQTYTADPRGAFVYHKTATPFGSSVWFNSTSGN